MNIFQQITRGKDEAYLHKAGILGEDGRLTNEGIKTVVDLIFIGKKIEEIRPLLINQAKKYVETNK